MSYLITAFLFLLSFAYVIISSRRLISEKYWLIPLEVALVGTFSDVFGLLANAGKIQYLVPLMVFCTVIFSRNTDKWNVGAITQGRIITIKKLVFLLVIYTGAGTLVGKLYSGTISGALTYFVSGTILLTYVTTNRNATNIQTISTQLSKICLLISIETLLSFLHILPSDALIHFNHERNFIIVLGIGTAIVSRNRILIFSSIIIFIGIFVVYPAGTYILAGLACLLTLTYVRIKKSKLNDFLFGSGFIIYIYIASFRIATFSETSINAQNFLGKSNNLFYRKLLIDKIQDRILEKPFFGDFFTKDLLVNVSYGTVLPIHNDYLSLMLGGGFLCILMLLSIIFWVNYTVKIGTVIRDSQSSLAIVFLCTFNAIFVTCAVNPILSKPVNTCLLFVFTGSLISLIRRNGLLELVKYRV